MLRRFSLYSFLKNQKYYEPFLFLAFIDKGLSFFEIGTLIGFRSICINLMEVPSGALADLYGRRLLDTLCLTPVDEHDPDAHFCKRCGVVLPTGVTPS